MRAFLLLACGLVAPALMAQYGVGKGRPVELFNQHCASCHGEDMRGGVGGSLLEGNWKNINDDLSFIDYVLNGNFEMGMPAFEELLSREEIRSLEIYVAEMQLKAEREGSPLPPPVAGVYERSGVRFRTETVIDGLDHPWALSFLPDGRGLVTERNGQLFVMELDGELTEISDLPDDIWRHGQGGLLEVKPHPDYERNGWIYLGYSANKGGKKEGMTKVVRGRISRDRWTGNEVIFETDSEFHRGAGQHFGTRFVFRDGYLFFSIGDRGAQDQAQDLTRPNGKVHRIHDDGRVPRDNPFVDDRDAYPTIWSLGNRNAQGLAKHPVSGELWESEHGPRGGDEINLIGRGLNYGWPVVTYGMNYNGTPITDKTEAPGFESPKLYWTPSIAVCGIEFYTGDRFPEWRNDLFVGGLSTKELRRLEIKDRKVVEDELILSGLGRVRDVADGPDGSLYVVLNGPGRIIRLTPED